MGYALKSAPSILSTHTIFVNLETKGVDYRSVVPWASPNASTNLQPCHDASMTVLLERNSTDPYFCWSCYSKRKEISFVETSSNLLTPFTSSTKVYLICVSELLIHSFDLNFLIHVFLHQSLVYYYLTTYLLNLFNSIFCSLSTTTTTIAQLTHETPKNLFKLSFKMQFSKVGVVC